MPLPLLLVGAAAVAGALGHVNAKDTNRKAEKILEEANKIYREGKWNLEQAQKETEEVLLKLGYSKKEVLETSMKKFLKIYKKIKNVEIKDSIGLNEIANFSISNQETIELKEMSDIYEKAFSKGTAGAATGVIIALAASGSLPVVTGVLSTAGSLAVAGNVGAAVGLASSALSLASSFTPLAAIAAPALLFTGISSTIKAEENLEKAKASRAEARAAVAKMEIAKTICEDISKSSKMFNELLIDLNEMFSYCTNLLDGVIRKKTWILGRMVRKKYLSEDEIKLIAVTRALAGAIKAVIDTPILTQEGKVSSNADDLYNDITYEKMPKFLNAVKDIKKCNFKETTVVTNLNIKNLLFILFILSLISCIIYFFIPKINITKLSSYKSVFVKSLNDKKTDNIDTYNILNENEKVNKHYDDNEFLKNTIIKYYPSGRVKFISDGYTEVTLKDKSTLEEISDKLDDLKKGIYEGEYINALVDFSYEIKYQIIAEKINKNLKNSDKEKIIELEERQIELSKLIQNKIYEEDRNKLKNENNKFINTNKVKQNKNLNIVKEEKNKSTKEIISSNSSNSKYSGFERNQFIILNGKSVFVDENGNILE